MKPTKQLQTLVKWLKAGSCGVFCHSVEAIICLFTKYVQAGRADSIGSDITFVPKGRFPSRSEAKSCNENPPQTCTRDSINMQKKPHNHSC